MHCPVNWSAFNMTRKIDQRMTKQEEEFILLCKLLIIPVASGNLISLFNGSKSVADIRLANKMPVRSTYKAIGDMQSGSLQSESQINQFQSHLDRPFYVNTGCSCPHMLNMRHSWVSTAAMRRSGSDYNKGFDKYLPALIQESTRNQFILHL